MDAGLKYPETDQLGVDVVVPDFEYLIKNTEKLLAFSCHTDTRMQLVLYRIFAASQCTDFGSELTIELAKLAIKDQPALKIIMITTLLMKKVKLTLVMLKYPSLIPHIQFQNH